MAVVCERTKAPGGPGGARARSSDPARRHRYGGRAAFLIDGTERSAGGRPLCPVGDGRHGHRAPPREALHFSRRMPLAGAPTQGDSDGRSASEVRRGGGTGADGRVSEAVFGPRPVITSPARLVRPPRRRLCTLSPVTAAIQRPPPFPSSRPPARGERRVRVRVAGWGFDRTPLSQNDPPGPARPVPLSRTEWRLPG